MVGSPAAGTQLPSGQAANEARRHREGRARLCSRLKAQRLIAVPLAGIICLCELPNHFAKEWAVTIGGFPVIHLLRAQTYIADFIILIVLLSSIADYRLYY